MCIPNQFSLSMCKQSFSFYNRMPCVPTSVFAAVIVTNSTVQHEATWFSAGDCLLSCS